jgi:anthranilate synthase component II
MILMVDNYDSFTYNLVQYLGALGAELTVWRNDKFTLDQVEELNPDHIVISPGPCTPKEAGLSCDVIKRFGSRVPLLGVCLGHQSIGYVYGGEVIRAPYVMHGKTSEIHHNGKGLFVDLPEPFTATRYHSLIVKREGLPDILEITAWTDDGIIMGLKHREYPVFGVQFHPESILTEPGMDIIRNFVNI